MSGYGPFVSPCYISLCAATEGGTHEVENADSEMKSVHVSHKCDRLVSRLPGSPAQIVKVFIALAVFCTYGLQWFVCLEIVWDGLKENFEKNVRLIEYVIRTILVVLSGKFSFSVENY